MWEGLGGDVCVRWVGWGCICFVSIVAAPGRLIHLLLEVKDFTLKEVEYLVFDEADRYDFWIYALDVNGMFSGVFLF